MWWVHDTTSSDLNTTHAIFYRPLTVLVLTRRITTDHTVEGVQSLDRKDCMTATEPVEKLGLAPSSVLSLITTMRDLLPRKNEGGG